MNLRLEFATCTFGRGDSFNRRGKFQPLPCLPPPLPQSASSSSYKTKIFKTETTVPRIVKLPGIMENGRLKLEDRSRQAANEIHRLWGIDKLKDIFKKHPEVLPQRWRHPMLHILAKIAWLTTREKAEELMYVQLELHSVLPGRACLLRSDSISFTTFAGASAHIASLSLY